MVVVNLDRRSTKEGMVTLGKIVHWKLARRCNYEAGDKWHEYESESVLEMKIIKSCGISVLRLIML